MDPGDEDASIAILNRSILQTGAVVMRGLCVHGLERLSMFQYITSNDGGGTGCAFAIRRIVLAFAVVSFFFVFFPKQAVAKYRDPYEFTTLAGGVRLIYIREDGTVSTRSSGDEVRNRSNGFRQIYTLNMRGKLLSRRFIVYSFNVNHTRNAVKSAHDTTVSGVTTATTGTDKNTITDYNLSTTLLPLSAIPLTLHAGHKHEETTGTSHSNMTTRTYGLDWSFNFTTLPETHLTYDTIKTTDESGYVTTQQYGLRALKEIGITRNDFNARRSHQDSSNGDKRSSTNLGYTNETRFSKRTKMTANASKIMTKSESNAGFDGTSVDMRLYSLPGTYFKQDHRYTYRLTESATVSEGTSYSGAVNYRLTDRLSTAVNLATYSNRSEGDSGELSTSSLVMNDVVRYKLTRRLTWRTNADYSYSRSNAADADKKGENWTEYQLTTGLDYKRVFKLFTLGLSGNGGYVVENVGSEGSATAKTKQGTTYGLGVSLSAIRLWNYAMMNTSYQMSQSKNTWNDSFTETKSYNVGVTNLAGRKYVLANAKYYKMTQDSWVASSVERGESYEGSISTNGQYFKNSEADLTVKNTKSFDGGTGTSLMSEAAAAASTRRDTFLGQSTFALSLARSKLNSIEENSVVHSNYSLFKIGQELSYFKKTSMALSIKRFTNYNNNETAEFNNETNAKIEHGRTLFGGNFFAEYSYDLLKRQYVTEYEAYKTHLLKTRLSRALFGGNASANYSFNSTSGAYLNSDEKYTTHSGDVSFFKPVSKNLTVELFALMSRTKGTFAYVEIPSVAEFKGGLMYALRKWQFTAFYSNKVSTYIDQKITDNRIVFSLGRGFLKVW